MLVAVQAYMRSAALVYPQPSFPWSRANYLRWLLIDSTEWARFNAAGFCSWPSWAVTWWRCSRRDAHEEEKKAVRSKLCDGETWLSVTADWKTSSLHHFQARTGPSRQVLIEFWCPTGPTDSLQVQTAFLLSDVGWSFLSLALNLDACILPHDTVLH